jgi:hypothetical protein
MIKRYQAILAIAVIIAMGIAGNMDVQEEERQHAEYCEMVQLWKQSGGQAGWPAYNWEGTCPKEKDAEVERLAEELRELEERAQRDEALLRKVLK